MINKNKSQQGETLGSTRTLKTWNQLSSTQQTLLKHVEKMQMVDRILEKNDLLSGPYLKHQETLILNKLEQARYAIDQDGHVEFYF